MLLREYLDEHGTLQVHVARKAGLSHRTIANALDGKDIRLSVALKIEDATKGQVTCRDLAPDSYLSKGEPDKYSKKKKKKPIA
jgi:DNA-binding transcriptional regulator YdaS (Cro superfamily)